MAGRYRKLNNKELLYFALGTKYCQDDHMKDGDMDSARIMRNTLSNI
jgi:hypothetical protein